MRIRMLLACAGAVALAALAGGAAVDRASAGPGGESPLAAADRLRAATGGNVSIRWAESTGAARFVRATGDTTLPTSSGSLADKASAFISTYGALFGVRSASSELVATGTSTDAAGSTVGYAQRYQGLPVFNTGLDVHFDAAGAITSVAGTFVPGVKVPTTPKVSAADAKAQALGAVAAAAGVDISTLTAAPATLGVVRTGLAADGPGTQALAWKTTVTDNLATRQFVYVDAISGGVVERFDGIARDRNRTVFNALSQPDYSLAQKCRGETDPASGEPDCDNAFTYAGDTYDFYRNGFARDSIDGKGFPLVSYVHWFDPTVCPNAFWNGSFMTYCSTFPHDDVAGHEITHGLTEFTAGLVYAYQPGALNESFSDIFGEAIDLMNSSENEPGSRWKIGEGIAPVGLRDMADPENPLYGNPASCGSSLYYCNSGDNGGVHTNSGVPNKAFQLMVDGGSLNGVAVTGIGIEKAVAVEYRALTRYLGVYSNFVDDYEALLASCRDLRGKRLSSPDPETGGFVMTSKISKADCAQVKNALDAVQMTQAVCTTTAPSPAGPMCTNGQVVASVFKDDHESGSPGWTSTNDTSLYAADTWQPVTDFAASGTHAWRINDPLTSCSGGDYTADAYLTSPVVNLSGTTRPILRFVHDFFTEGGYDGGTVEVLVNGTWTKVPKSAFTLNAYNGSISGSPNSTTLNSQAFTGYRHPGDFPKLTYYESRADLTNVVAQDTDKQVQIRFRFGTDYCNGTDVGWYLDDVEIYECTAPAAPAVTAAKV